MTTPIETTYGAILLGGFCAAVLSGVVAAQTVLYIKLFPQDSAKVKAIVGVVWTLDIMHTVLVDITIWIYLITNFGNAMKIDTIPTPLALAGLITAILTFIVHCSFSYRIHKLSRQKWGFTALILVLALFRLCCASVTSAEMMHLKTFTAFKAKFRWILTLGLAMSCLVDVLVTGFLIHTLRSLQSKNGPWARVSTTLDRVIATVILYTFETNVLTSTVTILSMICWLTMPNNMVFLGLHFFISKLYANSLLVTLNARKQFQDQRQRAASIDFGSIPRRMMDKVLSRNEPPTKLDISGVKMVEFGVNTPSPSQSIMQA